MSPENNARQWETEPDSENIAAGDLYPRHIRRVPGIGHLCGYIALPPEHPWSIIGDYDGIECSVHGGLTYHRGPRVVTSTQLDDFFGADFAPQGWHVFGFDCSHYGDRRPLAVFGGDGEYRTIEYVRDQLVSLALQAKSQA
jgi:hypothetical protein